MHRYGFANQALSESREDGLRLEGAWVTAVARCAPPDNKPTREEIERCRPFLVRELASLSELKVVLALGRIGYDGFLAAWRHSGRELPHPKPKFAHGSDDTLPGGVRLLGSYHPSQQNTFTGRLTRSMFHRVFRKARSLVDS